MALSFPALFSIDDLVILLAAAGLRVDLKVKRAA
jgi:hypothetical protein